MILYYSILILYYYYSTKYKNKLFHKNFLWKFLRCMDETFVFK